MLRLFDQGPEAVFLPVIQADSYGLHIGQVKKLPHSLMAGAASFPHQLLIVSIPEIIAQVEKNMEGFHFREALKECMNLARLGNKYLADTEPWKVAKTDLERVKTILNISLQIAANMTVLSDPFMPFSAEKLRGFLNIAPAKWDEMGASMIKAGHQLGEGGY